MQKYILIVAIMLSFNVNAANTCGDDLDNNCWDCGKTAADNCTARLDGTKLTIEGDGYMADYYTPSIGVSARPEGAVERPWGNNITNLEIKDGIKSIGFWAFHGTKISEINIPASVEEIRSGAFQGIIPLTNVNFAENSKLEIIGAGVFNAVPNLTEVNIPQSVKVLGANTFNLSGINSVVLNDAVFADDNNYEAGYFHGLNLIALSDVDNIYCSDAVREKCEEYFDQAKFWEKGVYYPIKEKATLNINNADGTVDTYRYNADGTVDTYRYGSDGTAAIYRDGKLKGYKGKRIFTIDEANAVAGKVNSVKIRYR